MERAQKEAILRDLKKKMVFLAGPRQSGKTTLCLQIAEEFPSSIYLNYDNSEDRRIIQNEAWPKGVDLVIFDEIHKMPQWKNYLKGVYDGRNTDQSFLVSGSARLEIFTEVGDSLAGRFFLHRLFPLSPSECARISQPYTLDHFMERGGFPEPFLAGNQVEARRWRLHYVDSLLRTDVLEFGNIQNVRAIRLLFELLQMRVGSPISYTSLSEEIGISPNSVRKYLSILEALYIIFRVTPFSRNIARSLIKEPKIYFFDTGLVQGDAGVVFENLVALALLKYVHERIDRLGENASLCYLRTKEQNEVDFALVEDRKLQHLMETKLSDSSMSRSLLYFHRRYGGKGTLVVKNLKKEKRCDDMDIVSADRFLSSLTVP